MRKTKTPKDAEKLERYRRLLDSCGNSLEYLCGVPCEGWTDAPTSVVREMSEMLSCVSAAGNDARIALGASSPFLAEELKDVQAHWWTAAEPVLKDLHTCDDRAAYLRKCAILAVQCEIVASVVSSILANLPAAQSTGGGTTEPKKPPMEPDDVEVYHEIGRRMEKHTGMTVTDVIKSMLVPTGANEAQSKWWPKMTKSRTAKVYPTFTPAKHHRNSKFVRDVVKRWSSYFSMFMAYKAWKDDEALKTP